MFAVSMVMFILDGAKAADVAGVARVIDGDTLEIGKTKIRLFGIDAPEGKQMCTLEGNPWNCGQDAKKALVDLIGDRPVTCRQHDIDRYRRIVGVCFIENLRDVNEAMVRQGWALAYRQYSRDYVSAEAHAQRERAGIWKSKFENPWDWRRKGR
jgi:endonuclease YncB( thermonuclease family)